MTKRNYMFPNFDRECAELRNSIVYYEFLKKHINKILYNSPLAIFERTWFSSDCYECTEEKEIPIIKFYYGGDALTQEEAIVDLASIMSNNNVIFEDIQWASQYGFSNDGFCGVYKGLGHWDDDLVIIKLFVPWMPEGCEIVAIEPEKKWVRRYLHPTKSVVCHKEIG